MEANGGELYAQKKEPLVRKGAYHLEVSDDGNDEPLSLTRNLGHAREAYKTRDASTSRRVHDGYSLSGEPSRHTEPHGQDGGADYLKSVVFGGLDGIVTIFALVSGCVGARLPILQIVIVAIGNLLADAISMGFGEFVGAQAEQDYVNAELAREEWEIENYPEGEIQEMIEIYERKYHMKPEDARLLITTSFKYHRFFLRHMMVEELGLKVDDGGPSPKAKGLVMFISFALFGTIPLLGFVSWSYVCRWWLSSSLRSQLPSPPSALSSASSAIADVASTAVASIAPSLTKPTAGGNHRLRDREALLAFTAAAVFSLITLFILGVVKGSFVNQKKFKSGFQMVLNGFVAGSVAFLVGSSLEELLGGHAPVG